MLSSVRAVQKIIGAAPAVDGRLFTVLGLRPSASATISIGLFERRWRLTAQPIVLDHENLLDSI